MCKCNGEYAKNLNLAERFEFCEDCRECSLADELPAWYYNFDKETDIIKFADGSGFNID